MTESAHRTAKCNRHNNRQRPDDFVRLHGPSGLFHRPRRFRVE